MIIKTCSNILEVRYKYICSVFEINSVHILAVGCTHFDTYAPGERTIFQSISIHYIDLCTQKYRRVHDSVSLCTRCVHKMKLNFEH